MDSSDCVLDRDMDVVCKYGLVVGGRLSRQTNDRGVGFHYSSSKWS